MENKTYAEAFGIINGLADIKIDFFSVDLIPGENNVLNEQRNLEQRVTISLPLAKDLAKKLSLAIANYEASFGPILDLDEAQKKAAQGNKHG